MKISCQGSGQELLFKNMENGEKLSGNIDELISRTKTLIREDKKESTSGMGSMSMEKPTAQKIEPDRTYQDEFKNEQIGFAKRQQLADYGLDAQDARLPLDKALKTLTTETGEGRYPLVALRPRQQPVVKEMYLRRDYHIYVAARCDSDLVLIDPSRLGGTIHAASMGEVRERFQHMLDWNPQHEFDILIYTRTAG